MASIREIAKLAEVSVGTASFVLNGKGDQMRISAATQKKVLEAADALGYRPNLSARRLRSRDQKDVPVLAILWTLDTRASLIGRFLKGVHQKLTDEKNGFELLIQPYENENLYKVDSLLSMTRFNGAIVANISKEDQDYLENANINVPIVLYQRNSEKYSNVYVDSFKTGKEVARLFTSRNHKNVGIIVPDISSQAVTQRKEGFLEGVSNYELNLSPEHVLFGDFSELGGYQAAKALLNRDRLPSALFFLSDQMALGALKAFHEAGIRIPEDLEIIGHDNSENTPYTVPSLSTIHLPVEEMASVCIKTLLDIVTNNIKDPVSIRFDTSFVFRQSCGGFDHGIRNKGGREK